VNANMALTADGRWAHNILAVQCASQSVNDRDQAFSDRLCGHRSIYGNAKAPVFPLA